ncbi:MAG: hypothetical protein QM642_03440 [Edaphocola sp.]
MAYQITKHEYERHFTGCPTKCDAAWGNPGSYFFRVCFFLEKVQGCQQLLFGNVDFGVLLQHYPELFVCFRFVFEKPAFCLLLHSAEYRIYAFVFSVCQTFSVSKAKNGKAGLIRVTKKEIDILSILTLPQPHKYFSWKKLLSKSAMLYLWA